VRMALGATAPTVMRMVLAEAARDLAVGAAAGIVCGVALCAMMRQLLENLVPVDALLTGLAVAVIVLVGLVAASLPALRVMRVDPALVLRS